MPGKLIVLSGTGTEIGKTHIAEALLLGWRALGIRAVGLKPVESGVDGSAPSDNERLAAASAFHVKPPYVLRLPVAPHLAARHGGVRLEPLAIASNISEARTQAPITLLELPGGLFSPLTDDVLNAEFAASLAPDATLLVAPDRLGVLHDVLATLRAATTVPLPLYGIVLSTPARPDLSTGTNAAELRARATIPLLAVADRRTPAELVPTLSSLAQALAP
jgi:dethiobiotin synthetase